MSVPAVVSGFLLLTVTNLSANAVDVVIEDQVVCSQDSVTFTCTVTDAQSLRWVAPPFISVEHNEVAFLPSDLQKNPTRTVTSNGTTFHAVLIHVDPVPGSGGPFTLQSTLSTTASATTNGTVIVCQEAFTDVSDNVTLQLLAPPPQPTGVQYNVTSHGTSSVTGDIAWNSSMDSLVDNYTVTVSSLDGSTDLMITVESSPLSNVVLDYNTNYTISVRGRNCAGSSTSDRLLYRISGCPAPSEPVNGSVSGFTSASVGSEVTYHCDTGLALVGERVAMCTQDLVWVPNGSEVTCQQLPPGESALPTSTPTLMPTVAVAPTSQSTLSAGVIAGIVVVLFFAIFLGVLSLVIAFIVHKTRSCENTSHANGTTGENSYFPEGEVVELQVHGPTTVPASYSTLQRSEENGAGQYSTPVVSSAIKATSKVMQYADLGPSSNHSVLPPTVAQDKIHYSTVDHTREAPRHPVAEPAPHPLDRDINPELIQRQIVGLRPQWRSFGSAAGLPHQFLDEVHSSYTDNKDCLAEVVYEWCGRVRTVTWADVARTCKKIGFYDLADALEKAYNTGILPFCDDETLSLTPSSKDLPPPLPPRGDSESSPPPELPPPPPPDALDDLPSRPPKPSTRHESPAAKAPVAPPRPPKPSTKPHPPPRT